MHNNGRRVFQLIRKSLLCIIYGAISFLWLVLTVLGQTDIWLIVYKQIK